jgi:hypothetical protein
VKGAENAIVERRGALCLIPFWRASILLRAILVATFMVVGPVFTLAKADDQSLRQTCAPNAEAVLCSAPSKNEELSRQVEVLFFEAEVDQLDDIVAWPPIRHVLAAMRFVEAVPAFGPHADRPLFRRSHPATGPPSHG